MKILSVAICILLVSVLLKTAAAQTPDTINKYKPDSTYIKAMSRYLTLRLSANNDIKGFHIANTTKFDLKPNDNTALKFGISYRWLSFSFSTAPKFIPGNDDDTLKGETKSSGFAFNFNFNHWMQAIAYNHVKGYYLSSTSSYPPEWQEGKDSYIQFPDLIYNGYSGQTAYKFNKNFSFNALSSQSERQLKSAGTFMPALSYNYCVVNNKVPLTGQNSSQKSNNFELLFNAGYFYTYVINKQFYISGGALAGAGFITTKLLTRLPEGNFTTHYTAAIYRFDGGVAAGYNAERFFAGAQLQFSDERYNQNKNINLVVTDRITYQVFAGYRLRAPAFLRNTLNKAEEQKNRIFK